MSYLVEAFKALEDIDDSVVKVVPKKRKTIKENLNEAQDDYWVLGDGKNPRRARVFAKIDDLDDFIADLEKSKEKYKSEGQDVGYWELIHMIKGHEKKVWDTESGKVDESCKLKEDDVYNMHPRYDSRNSFYGKARVIDKGDGYKILYSYNTPVVRIKDGKVTLLRRGYLGWASSQTTLRHVKEFLKQNGFEVGSVNDLAKMYPVEQALLSEDLDESMLKEDVVNLSDKDAVEDALEKVEKEEEQGPTEQIVDAEAETIEEVKDSYVGDYILTCPTCMKYFLKSPKEVHKDKDTGRFNVDESCPHCGATDGFEIKYQVAKADLDVDTPDERTMIKTDGEQSEEPVEVEEKEIKRPSIMSKESLKLSSLEGIDEANFDKLINEYLINTYENVESYKTTSGKIVDESCELTGTISYKSGKTRDVTFVFEKYDVNKESNHLRLHGMSESLKTGNKAFKLICSINDGCLICESLSYRYKTNKDELIKGTVKSL